MAPAIVPDHHLHHVGNGAVLALGGRAQPFRPGSMRKVSVVGLVVAMGSSRCSVYTANIL